MNNFKKSNNENKALLKVLFFIIPIILIIILLLITFWLSISSRFKETEKDFYLIEEPVDKKDDENTETSTKIKLHIPAYFNPTEQDLKLIAEHFSIIIGNIEQGVPFANQLKSLNPGIITLGYRDMVLMETNADVHKDWEIVNEREDWFVHDLNCNNGTDCRIRTPEGRYLMDIENTGWQSYVLNYLKLKLVKEEYENYDGVFLDDVWPALPWSGWMNNLHPSDSFIDNWQENVLTMLAKIKENLPKDKIVVINAGTNQQALNIVDGIMNEAFVHAPWQKNSEFQTVEEWKKDIDSLIYTMENHKFYLAQSGTVGETNNEIEEIMMFCLASYLLGAEEKSTFYFKDYHHPGYDKIFFYPEWNIDLGIPIEKYNLVSNQNNIYQREYSKGLVLVNPTNQESPLINLEKNYKNLENEIISKIHVPPYGGIILLNP